MRQLFCPVQVYAVRRIRTLYAPVMVYFEQKQSIQYNVMCAVHFTLQFWLALHVNSSLRIHIDHQSPHSARGLSNSSLSNISACLDRTMFWNTRRFSGPARARHAVSKTRRNEISAAFFYFVRTSVLISSRAHMFYSSLFFFFFLFPQFRLLAANADC